MSTHVLHISGPYYKLILKPQWLVGHRGILLSRLGRLGRLDCTASKNMAHATGRIFSRQQLAEIVLTSVQVGWGVLLAVWGHLWMQI